MGKSKDLATGAAYQDQTESDTRYVNASGDTMTGNLGIGAAPSFSTLEVTADKTTSNNLQLTLRGSTNTNKQMIMGFDTTADKSFITSQIAGSAQKPLVINSSAVTKPNQPFCSVAYTGGHITSSQAIDFNVITENNGSHYNSSNGRFTAPIAAHYKINVSVLSGSSTITGFSIDHNGAAVRKAECTRTGNGYVQVSANCILTLAANDYIEVKWKNGTIYGAGGNYTMMDVYLLG